MLHPRIHSRMQSITVPLQGFLNAMVYGWTREDFLVTPRAKSNSETTYGTADTEVESSMDEEGNEFRVESSTVNIMDISIKVPMDLEESVVYQETEMEDNDMDDSL